MCISYFQSDHMIHIILYIYGIPIFLAACALHINTQFYTCTFYMWHIQLQAKVNHNRYVKTQHLHAQVCQ